MSFTKAQVEALREKMKTDGMVVVHKAIEKKYGGHPEDMFEHNEKALTAFIKKNLPPSLAKGVLEYCSCDFDDIIHCMSETDRKKCGLPFTASVNFYDVEDAYIEKLDKIIESVCFDLTMAGAESDHKKILADFNKKVAKL